MATVEEVFDIIDKIATQFEEQVVLCMVENKHTMVMAVCEQLYSGLDGDGDHLNPNYDNDPFFKEEGEWYNRADDYKAWKNTITPPMSSSMLGLPPRPDNVPNLFINGKFYSEIFAERKDMELNIDVNGSGDGPSIVSKWGNEILNIGITAIQYFNEEKLIPHLKEFYEQCGYK